MKSKNPIKHRCCPNASCTHYEMFNKSNIIRHSFYKTRQGRRRRYKCTICNKTFCSTYGTPYYRLHDRRSVFDEVVEMSVHGITISSISKIKKMTWNTIARWLKIASNGAQRFNDQKLKNFVIHELQADEIRTFIQNKKHVIWLYTTMDVWSRLWGFYRRNDGWYCRKFKMSFSVKVISYHRFTMHFLLMFYLRCIM